MADHPSPAIPFGDSVRTFDPASKPLPDFRREIRLARTVGIASLAVAAVLMLVLIPAAKGVLRIAHLGTVHFEQIHVASSASADGVCAELHGVHGDDAGLRQWLTSGHSAGEPAEATIDVASSAPQGPESYQLSRVSVASFTEKPAVNGGPAQIDTVKVKCEKIAKSR